MDNARFIDLPGGKTVIMGRGDFAVGGCFSPELGLHGIVYMPLPDRRDPGTPTTDLFPVGSRAIDPAAIIYFESPAAIRQTMGYLIEKLAELEGKTAGVAMLAIDDVIAERHRQQTIEGWTPAHDDSHALGELSAAAECYVGATGRFSPCPAIWPWSTDWWKPSDMRRNLVKAGALILAEIERLDRNKATNAEA